MGRKYHPIPREWRARIAPLAKCVDEIQRNIEISIMWKKQYSKQFMMEFNNKADADVVCTILRYLSPDIKKLAVKPNTNSFAYIIYGIVAGKTPRLHRIKLPVSESLKKKEE